MSAALIIVMAIMTSAAIAVQAHAQEYPPGSPYYAPGTQPSEPPPDPFAILEEDGSKFSIPLPGGGDIQVQGPQSEPPRTMSPIEKWSVQRNTPFSVGAAPIGPAPTQP